MADKIIKGLLFDGNVNLIAINGTELIRDAKTRHGLSRVCTAALGRTLMITSVMGALLKNDTDRISTIINGGGPAGRIICTARRGGIVKGYIENPSLELPPTPGRQA